MSNPLRTYLIDEGITFASFAERIGVSPSQLTRLLNGERQADATTLDAINSETKGAVTPNDWVKWWRKIA